MKKIAILLAFILSACSSNPPTSVYKEAPSEKVKPVIPNTPEQTEPNIPKMSIIRGKCPAMFVLHEDDKFAISEKNNILIMNNSMYEYEYIIVFSKEKDMAHDFQEFNTVFKSVISEPEFRNVNKHEGHGDFWKNYTIAAKNDETASFRQEEFIVDTLRNLFHFLYMNEQNNNPSFDKRIYPNCDYTRQQQTAKLFTKFGQSNFVKFYTPLMANTLKKVKAE